MNECLKLLGYLVPLRKQLFRGSGTFWFTTASDIALSVSDLEKSAIFGHFLGPFLLIPQKLQNMGGSFLVPFASNLRRTISPEKFPAAGFQIADIHLLVPAGLGGPVGQTAVQSTH